MPAPSARKQPAPPLEAAAPDFDWRKIAYQTLVSRAMDDAEEATNRNRASIPKDHLVLYQLSARGHDMAQCILASRIDHPTAVSLATSSCSKVARSAWTFATT